jgi:tripartite-type tricarboxylate transporter receptor subunit TctC
MKPGLCVSLLTAIVIAFSAGIASAQNYPARPVRIVTAEPGGSTDLLSRILAQGVGDALGQPLIVDNRPSSITAETVAKAPADGYMLLLNANTIWIAALFHKANYDPFKDLAPVTLMAQAPNLLVTHPSLPVASVKDLIALAKAKPGALNYAHAGPGGAAQLAAELFKSMAKVSIIGVSYRGNGPSVSALMSGEVQLMFATAGSVSGSLKSGRLKLIAISTPKPSPLFAGVPTVAATLPGYESAALYGVFAPAKTPAAIISRLNREIGRYVQTADAKARLSSAGDEAIGSTPEELGEAVKADSARWDRVIKEAGIRLE